MENGSLESDEVPLLDTISIPEAAALLGVTERSVYSYVEDGSLIGFRIENRTLLRREDVLTYRRKPAGRARTRTPPWRQAPTNNQLSLTTITVRVYPEQRERLERKLLDIRDRCKHCFPGTAARYIVCDRQHPSEIQILLFWRNIVMPPEKEWQEALAAFCSDLAEVCAWETAELKDECVLLHA